MPGKPLCGPLERIGRRKAAGWSQRQIGEELERRTGRKVHPGQISRLERGERLPRQPLLDAYMELLDELAGERP